MSGPISPLLAAGEALRADLRPASRGPRLLAHPELGPAGAAAEQVGDGR
jgi:hypothetical protein